MQATDEINKVKQPEIRNRMDLHRFLEVVVNKTYELEKEHQRLEEDLNMVKSYIIESHKPVNELTASGYTIRVSKTDDPTLFIVNFKKTDMSKFSTLYVDVFDDRFWTAHTVEKSAIADPFIDKIARTELKKDYIWLPSQYMGRFKERGTIRGINLRYSEIMGEEAEKMIGDLRMRLRGAISGDVLELFRNLDNIKAFIPKECEKKLYHILEACEGLVHSSPLSGIGITYTSKDEEDSRYVLDDIMYQGKFTARGGNSIDSHLYLIRNTKEEYTNVIRYIEEEIAMGLVHNSPLRMMGHPISIILSREIEDIGLFSNELISCRYPFRLWGIPRNIAKDFVAITGVDLHTGDKLNLELSSDWIRLYLPKNSCGNTIARIYSIIQHNYDSNATLEGVEYGNLF